MTKPFNRLLFGTAGVPRSTPGTSTGEGISRVSELNLDCLEVEYVKGVKMGLDTAHLVRKEAEKHKITLSVHAPYYVSLNSPREGVRMMSQKHLLSSARLASEMGARCVVFHPGYYGINKPEEAFETIRKGISEVVSILRSERNPVIMRAETMGKRTQFGSLEEILFLCQEVEGLQPCIDFSHLYARKGEANSYLHFYRILTKISKKLGDEALQNMHIHISGSLFGDKGEIKHLNLAETDFRYDEWVQALKDFSVKGMVISESPDQETDAIMLKKLYYG